MAAKICFNCANDTENLKNIRDLHPALQKMIKIIADKVGYINYIVAKREFNTAGNNFLGELFEIDINGTTAKGDTETISLFIKKQMRLEKVKALNTNEVFLRELFVYAELSKAITFLQRTVGIPIDDRFKITKFYDSSNANFLIFENLTKKGFKTYGRLKPCLKFMELGVRELAKFHGISFVIEYKMPELHKNKIKCLKNPFSFDEDWKGLMEKIYLCTANLFDDEIKRKIEDFLPIAIKKFPFYERDQTSVKCCMTHNDFRTSNILVREIDGEPVEVVTIDFQLIDYGCPLRDFIFFIFSSTSREFRKQHLDSLKELYFNTLTRYLKYFDLDVEDVYPRKEFEKVYKQWLDFGLIKTLFTSVFLFAPENGLDVATLSLAELPFNPDKEFEERARGWIEDFIEWGYL